MVEVIAKLVDDTLIDGLWFKFAKTAAHITTRRRCTDHPQGSNLYTPANGTKLTEISLHGSDWLDPSTVRIMFAFYNTTAQPQIGFVLLVAQGHFPGG